METAPAVPQRKCVVCHQMRPRSELLRLAAPIRGGRIVPNPQGNTGGKGYYVCREGDCVAKLRTDRKMRKVFSCRIDDETYNWLSQQATDPNIPESPNQLRATAKVPSGLATDKL